MIDAAANHTPPGAKRVTADPFAPGSVFMTTEFPVIAQHDYRNRPGPRVYDPELRRARYDPPWPWDPTPRPYAWPDPPPIPLESQMKIISQLLADARGSCGGVIADRGKSGTILRARGRGADRRTPGQIRVRAIYANLEGLWSSISQDDRDTWKEAYTTTHFKPSTITISAGRAYQEPRELFKSVNLRLCCAGLTPVTRAPALLTYDAKPARVYAVTQSNIEISIDAPQPWQDNATAIVVKATRPASPGRSYKPANMRAIAWTTATTNVEQYSPLVVPIPYGPVRQVGGVIWISLYTVSPDGSCSTEQLSGPHAIQPD